jgi:hypothetical protein
MSSSTDRSDLHKRVATRIRNDVRLHLGPNALGQANAGLPVMLNYGEADAITDALFAALDDFGLAVVPAGGAEAATVRIRELAGGHSIERFGEVSDDHGNAWTRCSQTCDIHVVRPGWVRCRCQPKEMPL